MQKKRPCHLTGEALNLLEYLCAIELYCNTLLNDAEYVQNYCDQNYSELLLKKHHRKIQDLAERLRLRRQPLASLDSLLKVQHKSVHVLQAVDRMRQPQRW